MQVKGVVALRSLCRSCVTVDIMACLSLPVNTVHRFFANVRDAHVLLMYCSECLCVAVGCPVVRCGAVRPLAHSVSKLFTSSVLWSTTERCVVVRSLFLNS